MLKTNSKEAISRIRAYIEAEYCPDNYDENSPEATAATFSEKAAVILADLKRVKGYEVANYRRYSWQDAYHDYASGLPSLAPCEYFLGSATDILGALLDETEAEKARFSDSDAEKMLSKLIFRELTKAAPAVL